jgi:pyrimidine-nucleoside phosphorylase
MVDIAKKAGRKAVALLSDMNQPLGNAVGNALELKEAIETLKGGGPEDFKEHCLNVACQMLILGGISVNKEQARQIAEDALQRGLAWSRFRDLVSAQGGDITYVDHPEKLPLARFIKTVTAPNPGYLHQIHARIIGEAAVDLGGGRARKDDSIDHAVGIIVHQKVGNSIESGDPLFTIHANDESKLARACEQVMTAHQWSSDPVEPLPLFYGLVK